MANGLRKLIKRARKQQMTRKRKGTLRRSILKVEELEERIAP